MHRSIRRLSLILWVAVFSLPVSAFAVPITTWIVDTGPGFDQAGGASLYNDRPGVNRGYQSLAARFTLNEDVVIDTVQGWLNWGYGGRARFSIFTDFQGLPGASRFSRALELTATGLNDADWRGPQGLGWEVTQGDYWLVFEDVPGNLGFGAMPGGAPMPLLGYASSPGASGVSGAWQRADTLGLGVRVGIESVPAPATTALLLAGLGLLAMRARPADQLHEIRWQNEIRGQSLRDPHISTIA